MTQILYDAATTLGAPVGALYLALHPRHRPLLQRFAPLRASLEGQPLWFQACSVGEVATARPILAAAQARWPDRPLLLTASTRTGYEAAQSVLPAVSRAWFPFDHRASVASFFRRARPCALVLLETEIWPNVLREARRRGVPVVVFNGRLSDKHYRRYRALGALLRPVFSSIALAAVQNDEYADRFRSLGVPAEAVRVTGNTKFDGLTVADREETAAAVRAENGFPPEAPLVLFGSTRPGDEALARRCLDALVARFPELCLVVAPRHPDRLAEARSNFDEPVALRSDIVAGRRPGDERVFFLDTVGELRRLYAAATVAVIGGSFYPGVEGHNPLESAAWGVPTVFGPYMRNFIDPARALVEAGGAVQVPGPDDLPSALEALLADPDRRRSIGERGRGAILVNQGAIARSLDALAEVLAR